MASSTRKPIQSVMERRERMSKLKPTRSITANVPQMETGRAREGMMVLSAFPRQR